MLGIQEKESISEVLEILSYMEQKYVDKIPTNFLKFLQDNKDVNYERHIDVNKDISSQISKSKTRALLGILYYNFWCNEEEKRDFEKKLKENEAKKQIELSKNYNYEDLFKKDIKEEIKDEELPIIAKKAWYQKVINFLKKAFKREK